MKKIVVLLLLFLFVSEAYFGQGCSQCRLLAEQGSENMMDEQSFGSNINYGILYLLIIPYVLLMFLFRKRILLFFKQRILKKG